MIRLNQTDIEEAIQECEMAKVAKNGSHHETTLASQAPLFWRARMALMSGAPLVAGKQCNLAIAAIVAAFDAVPLTDGLDKKVGE
jgi:hypothetical protein